MTSKVKMTHTHTFCVKHPVLSLRRCTHNHCWETLNGNAFSWNNFIVNLTQGRSLQIHTHAGASYFTWAEKSMSFGSCTLPPSSLFRKSSKLPVDRGRKKVSVVKTQKKPQTNIIQMIITTGGNKVTTWGQPGGSYLSGLGPCEVGMS